MDKYLLEILKEVNTIIIPGLGALTITNNDTGEIMFMPYLKHDDGKLSAHIAEKEGMEDAEAKNLIAKYVREIQSKLDQGDTYDMYQFGTFKKDEAGDVIFSNWDSSRNDSTPASSEDIEISEKASESIIDEQIIEEELSTVEEERIVNDSAGIPIEEIKQEDKMVEEKAINPSYMESKKELNIAEKEEIQKNKDKLEQLKKQQERKKIKPKRGAGFYMLISLVAIMILGGVYVGLNFNEIKQHIPFLAEAKEKKVESSPLEEMKEIMGLNEAEEEIESEKTELPEEVEDPVEEEFEVEQEQETIVEKNSPSAVDAGNGDYHVIAGAFSSEVNANRLGEKLRKEGYSVKVGVGNGMHLVSIKSFSTHQEAKNSLGELKNTAPHAWIYYWPN